MGDSLSYLDNLLIRTYLAWQRKIGSYTKKHSYFMAKVLGFNS